MASGKTAGSKLLEFSLRELGRPSVQGIQKKFNGLWQSYEDLIGVAAVKAAQARVLQTETSLKHSQEERRQVQSRLQEITGQLRSLRSEIDRTPRGDLKYLELIKGEIEMIKEEKTVRTKFEDLERVEREVFSELSNALRMSHEKERQQTEKTKYIGIFGSVVGAFLGIVGTTINSRMRNKHTQEILAQTSSHVSEMQDSVEKLISRLDMSTTLEAVKLAEVMDKFMNLISESERNIKNKTSGILSAASVAEKKLEDLNSSVVGYGRGADEGGSSWRRIPLGEIVSSLTVIGLLGILMYKGF